MGQRANLLIIESGQRTLYYDHWCANRLERELFWGPEESARFARQREPVDEDGGWLDEVWCEGAAIVDFDRRVLLFFGGEDILFDARLRNVHLDLLRRQWEGWNVRWAAEGIMSIADELGMPRASFARKGDLDPAPFHVIEEYPEYNDVLVTERVADGTFRLGRVAGRAENLLPGPGALESLLESVPLRPRLEWTGAFPVGGVHLDRARRELTTWWADTTDGTRERMEAPWRGWTLHWQFDDFASHLRLCGDALSLPPFDVREMQRGLLDDLEQRLVDAPPRNPAREITDLGYGGELSPWTDHSRGRERSAEKRVRLAALRRELGL